MLLEWQSIVNNATGLTLLSITLDTSQQVLIKDSCYNIDVVLINSNINVVLSNNKVIEEWAQGKEAILRYLC